MKYILDTTDNLLNSVTMYRLVLYGLAGLSAIAVFFAAIGALSFSPLGMILSLLVLSIVCFIVNQGFRAVLNIPVNFESSIITMFILFFIVDPSTELQTIFINAGVAAAAIASKYVLTYQGRHIFNPAAAGVAILGLAGQFVGLWWVANPVMLPFVIILGLLVIRKVRRISMTLLFTATALVTMCIIGLIREQELGEILKIAFTSWPLIFFGTIMLTEPGTMPSKYRHQLIYALGVGFLFASQLHIGSVSSSPQNVLLLGNLYAFLVNPKYRPRLTFKSRRKLSTQTYDYVFAANKPIDFEAGQYMDWTLDLPLDKTDGRGNRRSFTIASSPTEKDIHLGVKFYEPSSTFKKRLALLEPGDTIVGGNISGDFTLPTSTKKPLLFIAGGIGITPFRSMIQFIIDTKQTRDIILLYAVKSRDEISYKDILKTAEKYGVRTHIVLERPSKDGLLAAVPDVMRRHVYISGSYAMVKNYRQLLLQSNVANARIKTDTFSGY